MPVIKLEKLFIMLGAPKQMRMIPNAPSLIHKGYNPVVYAEAVSAEEKQELQRLFLTWGEAPEVQEEKLEAYAILSAMGPTYFWFQWLKLQALGEKFGMCSEEVGKSLSAMLHGATETLFASGLPPEEVLDLIPVCPLKDDEPEIQRIFDQKLTGLYERLTSN